MLTRETTMPVRRTCILQRGVDSFFIQDAKQNKTKQNKNKTKQNKTKQKRPTLTYLLGEL
jgi:hypothetical protein